MLRLLLLLILGASSFSSYAEELWSWVRVEAAAPSAVIMRGHATTLSKGGGKLFLRLSDEGRLFDDFVVKIRYRTGGVDAVFEPPNTERIELKVSGVHRESNAGGAKIYEQFIFADVDSGNFLVISRFKNTK